MGPSDNRATQINMLALVDAESFPKATQQAALHDSLRATTQGDVSSKHRPRDNTMGEGKAQSRNARAGTSGPKLRAAWESPWVKYEKVYGTELGGPVDVAVRKASPVELVHMRTFTTQASAETLHLFRRLQHRNIVTALEAFTTDSSLYIVLEHMPISLEQIVRSPAYPNDRQLAAILGQVVAGVAYLAGEGYEHGSITCSNILLNTVGDVKIANQECCHVASQANGNLRDIRALSFVTMELMQKYVKEGGAIGVDNLHRWSSNSDALGFLSATTSVVSAEELLKHPLLSRPYQKDSLVGMISLAQVCMRGRYKYAPRE